MTAPNVPAPSPPPHRADLAFDPTDIALPVGLRRFGARLLDFQRKLEESRNPVVAAAPGGAFQRHPYFETAMPGHRLQAAGGRAPLFALQALARIERGTRKDPSVFERVLGDLKRLEDTLGDIDHWWACLQSGERRGLPAPVLVWAANKHAQACGRLEGWLAAGDWIDHKYLPTDVPFTLRTRSLSKLLLKQDWPSPKRDRRRVGRYFVARLRKVHEDALALDMNDLEGGVHELRRKLRWFSIYSASLDGLVALDLEAAPPTKGWQRYLGEAVVSSPFNRLPPPVSGVTPLTLPAPLFFALSWAIAELGRIKDAAQETEVVEHGLRATHQPGSASTWLGADALGYVEAGRAASKVVAQTLRRDRLLLRMADALEPQVD